MQDIIAFLLRNFLFLIVGIVIAFLLSGITWGVVIYLFMLIPTHWHKDMHKPLVVTAGVGGMVSGLILIGVVMLFFYGIGFTFNSISRTGPCYYHNYTNPSSGQAQNAADCQKALDQKYESEKPLLVMWLITPPWLRSSCDSVDPYLCTIIEPSPALNPWPQYIILILTGLASGLACARTVNKVYVLSTVPAETGLDE